MATTDAVGTDQARDEHCELVKRFTKDEAAYYKLGTLPPSAYAADACCRRRQAAGTDASQDRAERTQRAWTIIGKQRNRWIATVAETFLH
jgi:hypothetical protein